MNDECSAIETNDECNKKQWELLVSLFDCKNVIQTTTAGVMHRRSLVLKSRDEKPDWFFDASIHANNIQIKSQFNWQEVSNHQFDHKNWYRPIIQTPFWITLTEL